MSNRRIFVAGRGLDHPITEQEARAATRENWLGFLAACRARDLFFCLLWTLLSLLGILLFWL